MAPSEGARASPFPLLGVLVSDDRELDLRKSQILLDGKAMEFKTVSTAEGVWLTYMPQEALSAGRHTIKAVVKDTSGNEQRRKISFEVALGAPLEGMQMLSLPFIPIQAKAEGVFPVEGAKFALWTGQGYRVYPDQISEVPLEMGKGIWAKFPSAPVPSPLGRPVSPTEEASISLHSWTRTVGDLSNFPSQRHCHHRRKPAPFFCAP